MAGVSAQIQQLMDRVSSMKLEVPPSSAKQSPPLPEVIFVNKRSGHKLRKKREERKKRDGRYLNGGLCDQALLSLCMVLVLVIRLLVFGKKMYLIHDAALWMLA